MASFGKFSFGEKTYNFNGNLKNLFLQENKKLEGCFDSLRETLDSLFKQDSDLCESRTSLNSLRAKMLNRDELIEMVTSILGQFGKSKKHHFQDIRNCLTKMDDLQSKKNLYKKLSLKSTQKLKATEKELEEKMNQVTQLEEQNEKQSLFLKDLEEKVRELDASNKSKQAEIVSLDEKLELTNKENEAALESIREDVKTKMMALSQSLSYSVKVKDKRLATLEAEKKLSAAVETELKSQVDKLTLKLAKESSMTVENLKSDLQERDKEVGRLRQEISRAIVNLESPDLKVLKADNDQLRAAQKNLENKISDLEARLMDNKSLVTIKALENTLREKNEEIERLKRQIANPAAVASVKAEFDHERRDLQLLMKPATVKESRKGSLIQTNLKSQLGERDAVLKAAQNLCYALDTRAAELTETIRRKDEEHREAINSHKANLMVMKDQVKETNSFNSNRWLHYINPNDIFPSDTFQIVKGNLAKHCIKLLARVPGFAQCIFITRCKF